MADDLWYLGAFAQDDKHQKKWSCKRQESELGVVFKIFILPISFLITILSPACIWHMYKNEKANTDMKS